jgi:hypothetical protein
LRESTAVDGVDFGPFYSASAVFTPDLDGDGDGEIAVVSPIATVGTGHRKVSFYLGPLGTYVWQIVGGTQAGNVQAIAPAGDVNLDGHPDVLLGDPDFDLPVGNAGRLDVPTPLGGCVLHLDLAHAASWLLIPVATDAAGAFSFAFTIPAIPLVEGMPATMQMFLFGGPAGFELSNGLRATLGF